MVDAAPSRVREGSQQLPALAVEQLVVGMARAVGQVFPKMELRFGQVDIGPSASVHGAQDQYRARVHLCQPVPS